LQELTERWWPFDAGEQGNATDHRWLGRVPLEGTGSADVREEDLNAARAANRELMTRLNTP
jgi:hypothetical protein